MNLPVCLSVPHIFVNFACLGLTFCGCSCRPVGVGILHMWTFDVEQYYIKLLAMICMFKTSTYELFLKWAVIHDFRGMKDCHGIALPFDWEVQEVITSCSGRLFVPCNAVLLSNVVFLRSNKNITLSLAWNVIPNAGTLPKVNGDGGYTFEFPTEYSSSRS